MFNLQVLVYRGADYSILLFIIAVKGRDRILEHKVKILEHTVRILEHKVRIVEHKD